MEAATALAIAREVLPDTDDDGRWYALWNATGYPVFFGGDPETVLRQQLEDYRDGKPIDGHGPDWRLD